MLRIPLRQHLRRPVEQVRLRRDRPDRLVFLDRGDDGFGHLVRAVTPRRSNMFSSCARRVATAARLPEGAIISVADTMLVLMMPGQIVVNPIPAEDNSARRQSENMYTAALDVQ